MLRGDECDITHNNCENTKIVEREGFKMIYADIDSIYVHKPSASLSDYKYLRNTIENYFKSIP